MRTLTIVLCCAMLFAACKKDEHDHNHNHNTGVTAEINILSPAANAVYRKGENIPLEADVLGSGELHGYAVYIKTVDTDSVVFNHSAHSHSKSYQIRQNFQNTLDRNTDLKVVFEVAITHGGSTTTKEVTIRTNTE